MIFLHYQEVSHFFKTVVSGSGLYPFYIRIRIRSKNVPDPKALQNYPSQKAFSS